MTVRPPKWCSCVAATFGLIAMMSVDASAQSTAPTSAPVSVRPAMSRAEIEAGLRSRDRALFIKQGWIRDPFITRGPDDLYYLTGTTPDAGDPRESGEPFNTGLGGKSIVGSAVRIWRSRDLIEWENLGAPFTLARDSWHAADGREPGKLVWAPELHRFGDRWLLVHCPAEKANLSLSAGSDLKGPWTHPMGAALGQKHDLSVFHDVDADQWWIVWQNGMLAPLRKDLSGLAAEPIHLDPATTRTGPAGRPITRIGHEGATILKIGKKYVFLGTGWSTDVMRKGSYNLYYCTADAVTGPYGPRRFAGRFLGHGTPFQTRDGQWWCTAFYNGDVPPVPRDGITTRDLRETAQTINDRGTTIVPLDVRLNADGDVTIRALDPAYATPGPDENQTFED